MEFSKSLRFSRGKLVGAMELESQRVFVSFIMAGSRMLLDFFSCDVSAYFLLLSKRAGDLETAPIVVCLMCSRCLRSLHRLVTKLRMFDYVGSQQF